MSADNCDPKNLDICKNDAVFCHFPMQKLLDNPGTWSALKYKYGRLIVKDSNDLEWIYVIKSGEARVLKHLESGRVDVKARRKKIQKQMEEQSVYHKKKKILDFIADGTSRKSCYAPPNYHPRTLRRDTLTEGRMSSRQNCSGDYSGHDIRLRSQSAMPGCQRTTPPDVESNRPMTTNLPSRPSDLGSAKSLDSCRQRSTEDKENHTNFAVSIEVFDEDGGTTEDLEETTTTTTRDDYVKSATDRSRSSIPKDKAYARRRSRVGLRMPQEEEQGTALPPFVQIETLHPGSTFGLRSCLEQDERGPSVSLVSGDCEVLAINKKFFMKHCDDTLISLIRFKSKPFPSSTELVDRLDANMQWEEFKQETLKDFLKHRVRVTR